MITSARITPLQLIFFILNTAFGASMLILPNKLAPIAKEDMWLSALFAAVLMALAVFVTVKLAACFPNHTAAQYHQMLLGDTLGRFLNIIFFILIIMITVVFLRIFSLAVKIFLLDLTPSIVIVLLMLLPTAYAAQYGLMPVLRLQQFVFLPGYGLFLTIILPGILSIDLNNYKPFLADGLIPPLQAAIPAWFVYTGPEIALSLLYPYITKKSSTLKYCYIALLLLTLIYLLLVLITQGILGISDVKYLLIPTVMAFRSVEIPDTFIERLDGYLMSTWIVICFASLTCWLWLTAFVLRQVYNLEYIRPVVVLLVPAILYLVLLPPDIQAARKFTDYVTYASLAWSLGVVPVLLLLARLQRRRDGL